MGVPQTASYTLLRKDVERIRASKGRALFQKTDLRRVESELLQAGFTKHSIKRGSLQSQASWEQHGRNYGNSRATKRYDRHGGTYSVAHTRQARL